MNGCDRIRAAFAGERPDRIPIMLHNFMMAAREAGVSMREFRTDPEAIARSFIQAVETYEYDGIMIDVDTVTLAGALGTPVDLPEHEPARTRGGLLHDLAAVEGLAPPDIAHSPRAAIWLEAARLLKRHFGDEVLIRGNCDQCPFTLASLLRGMDGWLMEIVAPDNDERVHQLLEYCSGATLEFLRLMAATGVHMLSNGDSVAGPELVSPRIHRAYALPYESRAVRLSHELGLPYVLHICGNTEMILPDMVATGADGLELDYRTDARFAHRILQGQTVFVGNIDPSGVLAFGTPSLVEQKTRELLEVFADTPRFVLNAGCAIPPTTSPENLKAMIRTARTFVPDRPQSQAS